MFLFPLHYSVGTLTQNQPEKATLDICICVIKHFQSAAYSVFGRWGVRLIYGQVGGSRPGRQRKGIDFYNTGHPPFLFFILIVLLFLSQFLFFSPIPLDQSLYLFFSLSLSVSLCLFACPCLAPSLISISLAFSLFFYIVQYNERACSEKFLFGLTKQIAFRPFEADVKILIKPNVGIEKEFNTNRHTYLCIHWILFRAKGKIVIDG